MNVLLLSTGGGGGNIVRSVKALFHRDLTVTERTDPAYAQHLRTAVTTCCLDTNEFSLADLPAEERLLIGARTTGRLGARHNPDVARAALEESKAAVEALISRHAVIVLVGTGGKGTGAGTIFPLAQMARQQKKLVIPVFVRPSFERHEVDKRRYDHALGVSQQFDAAHIRLVEVLNDRGYTESDPKPQSIVWEQMNLPIARGLRGLLYVLSDLSQVDPSDLSTLFSGHGRLRLGFGEVHPAAGQDPTAEEVDQAIVACWQNRYCLFGKPPGTSLICIQGDWSNVIDAQIKGGLATLAMGGSGDHPYNPLFARAAHSPRPWGVTALFAEHTGVHAPLEIEWPFERIASSPIPSVEVPPVAVTVVDVLPVLETADQVEPPETPKRVRQFESLWEFAIAINRSEPDALALANNGANTGIPIDGAEVRKLVGTLWFRAVAPKLSQEWRTRLLDALIEEVVVPNHWVKAGSRRAVRIGDLNYGELRDLPPTSITDAIRTDLDFVLTIGRLFGADAIERLRFTENVGDPRPSKFMTLMHGLGRG